MKCGSFTNCQFLNVCGFFCSDFTFLPHKIFLNMKKPRMLLMKTVLLVWYCNAKIIFKTIKLIFAPKKWLWKLQMANFWLPLIKLPYKIWTNPSRKLFWMQNVLNFICHTMKSHSCHHTNAAIAWLASHGSCEKSNLHNGIMAIAPLNLREKLT